MAGKRYHDVFQHRDDDAGWSHVALVEVIRNGCVLDQAESNICEMFKGD
jgi:hypothetical protein